MAHLRLERNQMRTLGKLGNAPVMGPARFFSITLNTVFSESSQKKKGNTPKVSGNPA